MKLISTFLALCIGIFASAQEIDTEHSTVEFEIGNLWINTVEGTFSNLSGTVSFSLKNPSSAHFSVCVDAETIETGNAKRDAHLKTADFFDVAKYPLICIQSTKISSTPEGMHFTGTLTMHGVIKEIAFPFTFSNNTLIGTFTINRLDYSLGAETSTFTVGDEVEITITCKLKP